MNTRTKTYTTVLNLVAACGVGALGLVATFGVAAQGDDWAGIGSTRADWEAVYGAGEAGQNVMEYATEAGYPLYVGLSNDVIGSIEIDLTSEVGGGIAPDEAEALVEHYLPEDAELDSTFTVPWTPAHPQITITGTVWDSDWLEDTVADDQETVLVLVEDAPMADSLDLVVTSIILNLED